MNPESRQPLFLAVSQGNEPFLLGISQISRIVPSEQGGTTIYYNGHESIEIAKPFAQLSQLLQLVTLSTDKQPGPTTWEVF